MKNSIPAIFSLPSTYIQAFHRFQTDMRIFRLPPSAARCETTAGSSDFGDFDATSVPVALGCNASIWTRKAALKERHGEKHQYPLNIIKYHNLNYIIWYQYHSISNISIFNPLEYQGGFPVGPFVSNMYQFWPMVSFLTTVAIFKNTIRFLGIVSLVYWPDLTKRPYKVQPFAFGTLVWLTWLCFAHVDFSGQEIPGEMAEMPAKKGETTQSQRDWTMTTFFFNGRFYSGRECVTKE